MDDDETNDSPWDIYGDGDLVPAAGRVAERLQYLILQNAVKMQYHGKEKMDAIGKN